MITNTTIDQWITREIGRADSQPSGWLFTFHEMVQAIADGDVAPDEVQHLCSRLIAAAEEQDLHSFKSSEGDFIHTTRALVLADWLVSLDKPDSQERRTVTLTQIINRAREALGEPVAS